MTGWGHPKAILAHSTSQGTRREWLRETGPQTPERTMATAVSSGSRLLIAAMAVGLSACSEGSGSPVTPTTPVVSVIVDPPYGRIEVDETAQLGASLRDEIGAELSGRTVTWESLAASSASVSQSGLVRALAPGAAVISAKSEGGQGAALITVLGPVAMVTIMRSGWPDRPDSVLPGEGMSWQAEVRDTGANVLLRASVAWSSSDPAVATVDAHGHVVGVAPGRAEIAATSGGIAGKAGVIVIALSDLRGAWSMTEAGGCVTSGPVTLTQDLSRLTGTYEPTGTCHLTSGSSVDRSGTRHVNGSTRGSQVHFQTSGVLFCDYLGTIEGDPASRIAGSMECSIDEAGGDRIVTGTFTMTR